MPRICSRCGEDFVQADGSLDYRRHFCGDECSRADRHERMQAMRARLKTGRCPTCGHLAVRTPQGMGA
jgi:endogenous inhibitor of DNA gyrase (YacG/DUF329 family)